MKIVLVYDEPFPYGGAMTNRIISYAKEIVKQGNNYKVHCLQPDVTPTRAKKSSIPKPQVEGIYEGIEYVYPGGTIYWPESGTAKIKKQILRYKSYINSLRILLKERKSIDILQIVETPHKFVLFYYYFISRICNIKYVVERSELPDIYKYPEKFKTLKQKLYIWKTYKSFKLYDGWILETQTLVDYYIPKAKPGVRYCIVPMTVETDRFLDVNLTTSPFKIYGKYIAYCGNMMEQDGISILIRAFSVVSKKYPAIKLLLAGCSEDVPSQKKLVANLGIEDRVIFLGKILRDDVPKLLAGAYGLALASPTSIRSTASMPCKVGEYMCTGRPVIVTNLGEIPNYMTDGVSAYLAEPDSADLFADKIDELLSDSDRACQIGKEGQQIAIKEFGSSYQATRLIDFFASLNKN